jgi:hypothetical protein
VGVLAGSYLKLTNGKPRCAKGHPHPSSVKVGKGICTEHNRTAESTPAPTRITFYSQSSLSPSWRNEMTKEKNSTPKKLQIDHEWIFLEELRVFYMCAMELAEDSNTKSYFFKKAKEAQGHLVDKLIKIAGPHQEHLENEGGQK